MVTGACASWPGDTKKNCVKMHMASSKPYCLHVMHMFSGRQPSSRARAHGGAPPPPTWGAPPPIHTVWHTTRRSHPPPKHTVWHAMLTSLGDPPQLTFQELCDNFCLMLSSPRYCRGFLARAHTQTHCTHTQSHTSPPLLSAEVHTLNEV